MFFSCACIIVKNEVNDWCPVRVGLRQGSVRSIWLFNLNVGVVNANVYEDIETNWLRWPLSQWLFSDEQA